MRVGRKPLPYLSRDNYRPSCRQYLKFERQVGAPVCYKRLLTDFRMSKCCVFCATTSHHDRTAAAPWCWGEDDAALSVSRGRPAISPNIRSHFLTPTLLALDCKPFCKRLLVHRDGKSESRCTGLENVGASFEVVFESLNLTKSSPQLPAYSWDISRFIRKRRRAHSCGIRHA